MASGTMRVETAQKRHISDLAKLLNAVRLEDAPRHLATPDEIVEGLHRSLDHVPWLPSNWAWVLIGYVDDHPVGLAVLTRIPKMDHRLGFLYLDELHVLAPYRRRGVATALLDEAGSLARSLGLAGLRLLARPENVPAQQLYAHAGFLPADARLYERTFDPPPPHV